MFLSECMYQHERRRRGAQSALQFFADINQYTRLYGLTESSKPLVSAGPKPTRKAKVDQQPSASASLQGARTVFDVNEHFLELSNAEEEKRSLGLMLLVLFALLLAVPLSVSIRAIFGPAPMWFVCAMFSMFLSVFALCRFLIWPYMLAPAFFTSLRARYRFNRTARKVFALRPKKYGGNVVLDWSRVQAHVNWRSPKSWTAEQLLNDPAAREERARSTDLDCNLVLYWPPVDVNDSARKGEDVLWVGPSGSGEHLWQYIRTFMEQGSQAVPQPSVNEWLRKGFHEPAQHLEETVMHGSHLRDDLRGNDTSGATYTNYAVNFIWAPLHSLAERLCYWPTFPEEWNSDCGQRRRENGLGPEEPLRWEVTT